MFCEIIIEAYVEAFGLSYASGECHSPYLFMNFIGVESMLVLKCFLAVIRDVFNCMIKLSIICYVLMCWWPHLSSGQNEMVFWWCDICTTPVPGTKWVGCIWFVMRHYLSIRGINEHGYLWWLMMIMVTLWYLCILMVNLLCGWCQTYDISPT